VIRRDHRKISPLFNQVARRNAAGGQINLEINHVTTDTTTHQSAQEAELAQLIVDTLNLEQAAAEIDPQAALYGEGLGLDSIDMLEISLAVAQHYGVKLRAEDKNNAQIFSSLRNLNAFIQLHRAD